MKRLWIVGLVLLGVGVLLWVGQEENAPPVILSAEAAHTQGLAVRYTSLVCRELVCYDGAFLEDGSDEERIGVAALVLENTGTVPISRAQVVVLQGEKRLYFDVSFLPAQSRVLVLERTGAPYCGPKMDGSYCMTLIPGQFGYTEGIGLEDTGMELTVTNGQDRELTLVRLHYKQYYGPDKLYLGGITYTAELYCLLPGERRTVRPYHYAPGYARIVAVEIVE